MNAYQIAEMNSHLNAAERAVREAVQSVNRANETGRAAGADVDFLDSLEDLLARLERQAIELCQIAAPE